jgi:hypothetical protein
MRRVLVLLLLVCLLPLRAWAGDAMALAHAHAQHTTPVAHATQAGEPSAHCHEQATAGTGAHPQAPSSHAPACSGCDICHSQAACDSTLTWIAAPLPSPPLAHGPLRFASALPLPRFKPPRA